MAVCSVRVNDIQLPSDVVFSQTWKFLIDKSITCTHPRPRSHRTSSNTHTSIVLLSLANTYTHARFIHCINHSHAPTSSCSALSLVEETRNSHLHSGTPKTSSVCPFATCSAAKQASKQLRQSSCRYRLYIVSSYLTSPASNKPQHQPNQTTTSQSQNPKQQQCSPPSTPNSSALQPPSPHAAPASASATSPRAAPTQTPDTPRARWISSRTR